MVEVGDVVEGTMESVTPGLPTMQVESRPFRLDFDHERYEGTPQHETLFEKYEGLSL